ncbi:MAG: EamA family transporter [Azospirillaceae bacterium]|nr:EamA family transporter [Azospirillaceae bacterium]
MSNLQHPATADRLRATMIGGTAILIWSTLASLATLVSTIPPFQIVALSFAIASLIGAGWTITRGDNPLRYARQPALAWLVGVGGLFGYHFLFFIALQSAPPVEANLINYLWPLLIVLFASALPGHRLQSGPIVGALAGLGGTLLLVTQGGSVSLNTADLPGYAAALASAIIWAGYSVLRRHLARSPTEALTGFCLVTALLSLACHWILETTVWPDQAAGWLALLGLGLGPVGAAFFVWDHGVRHGDIRVLGALSYLTPLLSTGLLIACGLATGHWTVWVSCLLIAGGSLLASQELLRDRRPRAFSDQVGSGWAQKMRQNKDLELFPIQRDRKQL